MMTAKAVSVVLAPDDSALAASALPLVDAALAGDGPVRLRLVSEGQDVEVPRPALAAMGRALAVLAEGDSVTVLPTRTELTTQRAADILRVSRPFLIGLLEAGEIDFRKVGSHRRVRAASLAAYMKADDARRRAAADELSAEAYDLGLI
ncbi:MAG: helix-turn-helix domain-containing protein [Propionibacteriaceae bacterium]|nr:helix-turn-helix domain-containing protein [Propionibacteriaceae bacterium]